MEKIKVHFRPMLFFFLSPGYMKLYISKKKVIANPKDNGIGSILTYEGISKDVISHTDNAFFPSYNTANTAIMNITKNTTNNRFKYFVN